MTVKGKVGWGVIGCCGIARRRTIPEGIVPAENATLAAVMDVAADGARETAGEFKVKCHETIDDVLSDPDVHAVYIATPNHLHKTQVLAAAEHGKHVLCEKPLANNTADIKEMIEACKNAGVLLGIGFMMRFNAYHRKLRDMIKEGALGVPVLARGQMTCWYPPMEAAWRQDPALGGGGALVDLGSHVVDVLEMLFGPTKAVSARCCNRVHNYPVEDTVVLHMEFSSGVPAIMDFSFAIPDEASEFVLEVYGSRGAIKGKYSLAQGPGGDFRACLLGNARGYDARQQVDEKGGYQPWQLETKNTYQSEIEAFSQAIIEGESAPVPGEDGLWNHIVMEAVYESARTGKEIQPRPG